MVLPDSRVSPLVALLQASGLTLVHSGKVRDTFSLPGHPDQLLVVASDRVSIFDFVLSANITLKGEVLTALSVYWFRHLSTKGIDHHMLAAGAEIDRYLPDVLRGNSELQRRAMVVRKLTMLPVEFVFRGYLTGSGWKEYQARGTVCGVPLPPGLHDGSKLEELLFSPTSKADIGHDLPMDPAEVERTYGLEVVDLARRTYQHLAAAAAACGIILADTKFELGRDSDGKIYVADEVGTPDSSRFWKWSDWARDAEQHRAPSGFDKEIVRGWGKLVETGYKDYPTMNLLDPANPGHLNFVDELEVPASVISETSGRYLEIFRIITGFSLKDYQRAVLSIY